MKNNILVKNFLGILITTLVFAGFYVSFLLGQYSVGKKSGKGKGQQQSPEGRPKTKKPKGKNNGDSLVQDKSGHIFYGESAPYEKTNIQGEMGAKIVKLKHQKGDPVEKNEVIVQFDTSKIDLEIKRTASKKKATTQKVKEAEAEYQSALKDQQRNKELFAKGTISTKDVEDGNNRLQTAQTSLRNAKEELEQIEIDLNLLHKKIQESKLPSPIKGIVSLQNYNLQEIYKAGDTLYEIINIDKIYVNVKVPESYIKNIRPEMKAKVVFIAIDNQEYPGVVKQILPKSEQDGYNFVVRVLIDNPKHRVLPGMFAKIKM